MRALHSVVFSLLCLLSSACGGGSNGDDAEDVVDEATTAEAPDGDDVGESSETSPDEGDAADVEAEADAFTPGWQPPVETHRPLEDYIEAVQTTMGLGLDEFDHAVKELEVFDDRLYLGYGDWTQNTGRAVGMSVRYLSEPELDAVSEFTIEEESIDYYRITSGGLYIPGVDAAEDALLGNVYFKPPAGTWTKARTLEQNLHVIDVYEYDGALFASGGGCDDMDHYYSGDDQGVLYRSDDAGLTWTIVLDVHDPGASSVIRYEYFAEVEGNLYVFGNRIDTTTSTLTNIPRRYDAGAWTEVTLLPAAWVLRTYQLDATTAVVRGVDLGTGTFRAWRVLAGESARVLSRLDSMGVMPLDFFSVAPGDMLILAREGNEYPDAATAPFTYHVFRTADLFELDELLTFASDESFVAIALWRDSLWLGSASGGVWRSAYLP